ncbi:ABC transporter substrate-binding protein [Halorarum salinum]|uniref:ABC transporter substrate-binding protein n=1 Tax=Halorarum salinum TaxID=2743089 RepID=A0A7D5LEE9_9EURY|nr:ABC transporter substrate-binding protein [Halobaculum salinum]
MGGGSGELLDEMVTGFPDATAQSEYQGSYEDVLNNVFGSLDSGNAPDLAMIDSLHAQQILDTEATVPVEEMLPDGFDPGNLIDTVTDFFTLDGALQSMPFNNSNAVLYYNKDVFEEAGLDPESPPETLAEVRGYSEQIVDAGAADYGITWPNHVWFVEHWYALANQLLVDEENGHAGSPSTLLTDNQFAVDLWTWWQGMYEDGLYTNPGIEAWGEARSAFLSGTAAMELDSTAAVAGHLESAEEEGFELGTGYYPAMDGRTGVPIGGASFWALGEPSEERQADLGNLVAHLASPENQVEWHKGSGYYAIHEDAVDRLEDEGWFEENPEYTTAFDQLYESEATPATRRMLVGPAREVSLTIQETSVEIFSGDSSVEDGLSSMRSDVEDEFERYERVVGQ